MSRIALFLLTTALASPALALPATEEGAARIKAAFATYLGSAADAVQVAAQGETYALTLDATPLFLLGQAAGVTGQASPLVFKLTDQGAGQWDVTLDQPVSVRASLPDALDLTQTIEKVTFAGRFDESLVNFATMQASLQGLKTDEVVKAPGQPDTHVVITMESSTLTGTTTANPAAGVDATYQATATGLVESFDMVLDPGQPGILVTMKAESMEQSGSMTGLRMTELLPILAWAVAHPDPVQAAADRATVKGLIQAALPVFDTLDGTATVRMLSTDTPLGAFGLTEAGFDIAANGLGAEGKVLEGLRVKGLTLPDGLVPAWAQPLIPQELTLEGQVTGFDAGAAVAVALTALDLPDGQDPAPEFGDTVLAALIPQGTVTVGLNPGGAKNDLYALTWEGGLEAGPQTEIPTFNAKLSLTGMDTVLKALNDAPDDMKMPAMMGLGAMRGIAKPGEGGALMWEIDGSTPGQVLVNGMDISQIGGAN